VLFAQQAWQSQQAGEPHWLTMKINGNSRENQIELSP